MRFLVGEFLANRLELRVVPHSIESRVAYGDEPKFPALQAAQELERGIALTKTYMDQRLIEHQHTITWALFSQSLNARESCASRGGRVISCFDGSQRVRQ